MTPEDIPGGLGFGHGEISKLHRDVAVLQAEVGWMKTSMEIMTRLPTAVAELSLNHDQLEGELRDYIKECKEDTKYLRDRLDQRDKERKQETKDRRAERKSDLKYLITTIIATGGLTAAAIALFH